MGMIPLQSVTADRSPWTGRDHVTRQGIAYESVVGWDPCCIARLLYTVKHILCQKICSWVVTILGVQWALYRR